MAITGLNIVEVPNSNGSNAIELMEDGQIDRLRDGRLRLKMDL
jgi:hypothetical protein